MELKSLVEPSKLIIEAAEMASNLARYDGVKFEPAIKNAKNLDELYKKSRSLCFDYETKKKIILGYFVLSKNNYEDYFIKAKKIMLHNKGGAKC